MADLTSLLSRFLSNLPKFSGGVSGVLESSTTQVGTAANTTETDLWTYSLPANTLSANGKVIRITAFGSYAANANTKTFRVYFGATVVAGIAAASNGNGWSSVVTITRTGAAAQVATTVSQAVAAAGLDSRLTTPAADTTGAITIKVTGQNGTASANDVVFRGAVVELLN